uniref:Uncharacterized protein n=1 Tax=Aegilops tauschii subsp. strangulata TaxID=200361 RepID=A0A453JC75_AEGTS
MRREDLTSPTCNPDRTARIGPWADKTLTPSTAEESKSPFAVVGLPTPIFSH